MKKIMFNDQYGLTNAVLEGRKTQTRRVIKDLDKVLFYDFGIEDNGKQYASFVYNEVNIYIDIFLPYQVGEVVAIAQSYKDAGVDCDFRFAPAISKEQAKMLAGWSNKMFVKAELMPHHILITNVRVEKLQSISEEDCLEEGIIFHPNDSPDIYYFFDNESSLWNGFNTAKKAYATLIDEVGKKGTWESNPYVFVYEFELVD